MCSSRASAWGPERRESRLDSRAGVLKRTGGRAMGRQRQRRIEHGRLKNQRKETGSAGATGTSEQEEKAGEEERSQRRVPSRESRHRGVRPLVPAVSPKAVSCLVRSATDLPHLDHFDHTLSGSHDLALAGLCREGWPGTQRFAFLCLPSAGIKGKRHHVWSLLLSSLF